MNKGYFTELNNRLDHALNRVKVLNDEIYGPTPEPSTLTDSAVASDPCLNFLASQAMEKIDQVHTQLSALEDVIKGK